MKTISILVPCFNEEQALPIFLNKIKIITENINYRWQILLVDDGSTDSTLSIMKLAHQQDSHIDYIELSRNFGKEAAMLAGLDYVNGDAVIIMDADLQHPISVIPQMIEQWGLGYDDVFGRRIIRGKETWLRKKMTQIYYHLLQQSTTMNMYPNVGDFRLLDRSCIEALRSMRESNRYTKGLYAYIGFRKQHVDYVQEERVAGTSKWNFWTLTKFALDGLFASSIKPLQYATKLGFLVSFIAFIYLIYVFIKALIWGDPVQGFPTLIIVILLLGGLQLCSIGIMGEYIGRTFHESKNRPTYFIRTYNGQKQK